jgi:hypothetical protein
MDPTLAQNYPDGGAVYFFQRTNGSWHEDHKLVAFDGAIRDSFGFAVGLAGTTAVVGAPNDDDNGVNSGSVYVLVRSGQSWGVQQKLPSPSSIPGPGQFGWSVTVQGDTLLGGAPYESSLGNSAGAAFVYQRTGSTWVLQQELFAPDAVPFDFFGISVALDGDTALVGAAQYYPATGGPGAAYVFVRSGSTWSLQQKLTASDGVARDLFGYAVALQGDAAVIGANQTPDYSDPHAGKAYVFGRAGTSWTELQTLEASPSGNYAFGRSVTLDGTRAVLGAPGDGAQGFAAGAAFVFALKSAKGDPCGVGTECASGFCVDDVCCDSACGDDDRADCLVCSVAAGALADGTCTPRPDQAVCDDRLYCNGPDRCQSGACALHGADPCTGPDGDDDCRESCDEPSDTCTAPDPDGSSCTNGSCGSGICRQELGGSCADASGCQSGFCVVGVCCLQADCGAYRCASDGACLAACATTADCAPGQQCSSAGQCVPAIGQELPAAGCSCSLPRSIPARGPGSVALLLLAGAVGLRRRHAGRLALAAGLASLAACHDGALSELTSPGRPPLGAHEPSAGDRAGRSPLDANRGSTGAPGGRDRSLVWAQGEKLTSPQATLGDLMGWAVALDGSTALIGVPSNPYAGIQRGSVLCFVHGADGWGSPQSLEAGDGWSGDGFGYAVAMHGDTALVGATMPPYYNPSYPAAGAVYVLARQGEEWVEQQKLVPSDGQPGDTFGIAVAFDGDTAVVGAPFDDDLGTSSGSAYVLVQSGGVWSEQQKLLASDGSSSDRFGHSVAIAGDTLLVGATSADGLVAQAGAVYVFGRSGSVWSEQQKLVVQDVAAKLSLGGAVALDGDTALLGAPADPTLGVEAGSAYLFVRSGSTWSEQQKLLPHDGKAHDNFGETTVLAGDTAVVAGTETPDMTQPGPGAAYVFGRTAGTWAERQRLVAQPPANYALGHGVSLGATRMLLGASGDSDGALAAGSVFVFELKATNGDPCASGQECVSGFCVDGVCCDSVCGNDDPADCSVCSLAAGAPADGTCGPLADAASCDDGLYCNGPDQCLGGQCASHGQDPCGGPDSDDDCRESCSELDHSCTGPDPDGAACPGGLCGGGVCQKELGGSCQDATGCQSGFCMVGVCCVQADCGAYGCGPDGACLGTCDSTVDCAAGFQCSSAGACVPAVAADAADAPACSCASPGRPGAPRPFELGAAWLGAALLRAARPRRRGRRVP